MRRITLLISSIVLFSAISIAQSNNTSLFTVFTSAGCGCTGSGGAPMTFTTHDQVLSQLRQACEKIDFIRWEGTYGDAFNEVEKNRGNYDGVLIIGRLNGDYRLAFTGLPTIVVYNLFEFMDGQPYHLFTTGLMDDESNILKGSSGYKNMKILTAQLDRRNLCAPAVRDSMFNDLVYKIKLIGVVKELGKTRILMVKRATDEIIASVNYRGDYNQAFVRDHNEQSIKILKDLFGISVVSVEPEEFYLTYKNIDIRKAGETADKWIKGARKVEASRNEVIKTARGYLALDELRVKYNCNAVSTHIRTVTGSGELKDLYNPGVGLELGFKTRGIQAVCQNYPDLLITQVLGYLLTGKPSMLSDFIYDAFNETEIVLHCGIPVNPFGDDRVLPYTLRTHAESPVRDRPEQPGSSTGMTVEWPAGEPVTFWEIHSMIGEVRLNTGVIVNGKLIYNGGEDLDNVMCTGKIVAKVDNAKKLQEEFRPYLYGIHTNATLGDLRSQIKDVAVLLGLKVTETDR